MENELVKKICSKQGFERAASEFINNPDLQTFKALAEKFDFLFDFVKQNVLNRLQSCVNELNYLNLLKFLPFYSSYFEEFIVNNLKKYGEENVQSIMLNKLKNGTIDEKTYCIKYFEGNNSVTETVRELIYNDFEPLTYNCGTFLGKINDETSYQTAIETLKNSDDFKVLKASKFLSAYHSKKAIPKLFEAMKKSSVSENIALEILYMEDIFNLLEEYPKDSLLLINNIVNTLSDVIPLSTIFDIKLYELVENLDSATTLLNIKLKIEQLTENDEYLFDEDKSVKEEIYAIKELINSKPKSYWDSLCDELTLDDNLMYFTLNIIGELNLDYSDEIKDLIDKSSNASVVLKSVETMKILNKLEKISLNDIIRKFEDKNIKEILKSYFQNI